MDRGAWQATVHGVARVGHSLATKPPPYVTSDDSLIFTSSKSQISGIFSYTFFYGHNYFYLSKYLRVELLNDGIVKYVRSCHIDGAVLPITLNEIFTLPVSTIGESRQLV